MVRPTELTPINGCFTAQRKIDLLDKGYVRLVDRMGDDLSVLRAARVSYDAEWRTGDDAGKDEKLVHYLKKNEHTSPFEAVVFSFEVKAPIFVFRQWHRSRTQSYNEISARYTELPDEYYVPDESQITTQSTSNKQMRTADQHPYAEMFRLRVQESCDRSFDVYKELLGMDFPRELCRGVLPFFTYSRMYATVNLHNLFHFLKLRLHEHAQYEIRVYAEAMLKLVDEYVPISVAAFKLHVLGKREEEARLRAKIEQLEAWKDYAMNKYFDAVGENLDEVPGALERV